MSIPVAPVNVSPLIINPSVETVNNSLPAVSPTNSSPTHSNNINNNNTINSINTPQSLISVIPIPPLTSSPWVYSSTLFGRISPSCIQFDDRNYLINHAGNTRIVELYVYSNNKCITAIQCIYEVYNYMTEEFTKIRGPIHGDTYKINPSILLLNNDEYINKVTGTKSNFITSLTITTSKGVKKTYGINNPLNNDFDFECELPNNNRLIGFQGGYINSTGIEAIGVLYSTINNKLVFNNNIDANMNNLSLTATKSIK